MAYLNPRLIQAEYEDLQYLIRTGVLRGPARLLANALIAATFWFGGAQAVKYTQLSPEQQHKVWSVAEAKLNDALKTTTDPQATGKVIMHVVSDVTKNAEKILKNVGTKVMDVAHKAQEATKDTEHYDYNKYKNVK